MVSRCLIERKRRSARSWRHFLRPGRLWDNLIENIFFDFHEPFGIHIREMELFLSLKLYPLTLNISMVPMQQKPEFGSVPKLK